MLDFDGTYKVVLGKSLLDQSKSLVTDYNELKENFTRATQQINLEVLNEAQTGRAHHINQFSENVTERKLLFEAVSNKRSRMCSYDCSQVSVPEDTVNCIILFDSVRQVLVLERADCYNINSASGMMMSNKDRAPDAELAKSLSLPGQHTAATETTPRNISTLLTTGKHFATPSPKTQHSTKSLGRLTDKPNVNKSIAKHRQAETTSSKVSDVSNIKPTHSLNSRKVPADSNIKPTQSLNNSAKSQEDKNGGNSSPHSDDEWKELDGDLQALLSDDNTPKPSKKAKISNSTETSFNTDPSKTVPQTETKTSSRRSSVLQTPDTLRGHSSLFGSPEYLDSLANTAEKPESLTVLNESDDEEDFFEEVLDPIPAFSPPKHSSRIFSSNSPNKLHRSSSIADFSEEEFSNLEKEMEQSLS
ncbi:hypothetical protein BB561_001034 [Smittium simulii]|uniref:Uncharacterized protein n=1 Tax=Smittium simulii TaxID=133385 RepID=A0A2T9YWG4_9FUNG|nr:hypothetical protein BB561_001034 [Smittium simulii]